jgi:hypothetical protein
MIAVCSPRLSGEGQGVRAACHQDCAGIAAERQNVNSRVVEHSERARLWFAHALTAASAATHGFAAGRAEYPVVAETVLRLQCNRARHSPRSIYAHPLT